MSRMRPPHQRGHARRGGGRTVGDDFCQSFYTAPPPDGAYGPGHRCVPLIPKKGDLILDVVRNRIMYVEVLYYPSLRGATSRSTGPDGA